MFLVKKNFQCEIDVKKSIFISVLAPYEYFTEVHEKLKAEHPKATHIVWAYRYINEFHQIVENQTDDNEPKGCAGTPTLNVMRGHQLVNTAIFTVRYFGGTKLGKGGMVRGYTASAKEVLTQAELQKYEEKFAVDFETNYNDVRRYEHFFQTNNISVYTREFLENLVKWHMSLTEVEKKLFESFHHD